MPLITKWINHINWGYATAFMLLIGGFVLSTFVSANLYTLSNSISEKDSTINHLTELLTSLKSAQVSWGQYSLTKNYKSLTQYYNKSKEIDSLFISIYNSSSISEQQKDRLDTLRILLSVLFSKDSLNPVLRYRRNAGRLLDSLQNMTVRNSSLVDSITSVITDIHEKMQSKANERKDTLNSWSSYLKILGYFLLGVALFLSIHMLIIYNRERGAKNIAKGQAENYHRQLEARIQELTKINKEILRLKSLEKYTALGRVATTIAHDIKNPLTSINMALAELEDETQTADRKTYFDIIKRNCERIKDQINHFLNVTAFIKLNTQPVSINHLLDDVLQEAADRINLGNIVVEKHYTKGLDKIAVDPERIKIAFLNLVTNAIEAMEANQNLLKITTLNKENKCVIIIEDNGNGMDEETSSKIFEPYYTTKLKNGSGLGLAQTQNIILNHNGNIEVESKRGDGTRFIVTLNFAL